MIQNDLEFRAYEDNRPLVMFLEETTDELKERGVEYDSKYITHIYMRKWDKGRRQKVKGKPILRKEMRTLSTKIYKADKSLFFQYAIEKNKEGDAVLYHVHIIVHHSDYDNLVYRVRKFIKAGHCYTAYGNEEGIRFGRMVGNYGYADYMPVYNLKGAYDYLNKTTEGLCITR
jgi:hypothetical protein